MIGVVVSLVGVLGSFWLLVAYGRTVWGFALLALFAVLGWTSFIWCGIWAESPPEERIGPGVIGVVAGGIGLGVGLVAVVVYRAPRWSYVLVAVSFLVFAVSLVAWGRTG